MGQACRAKTGQAKAPMCGSERGHARNEPKGRSHGDGGDGRERRKMAAGDRLSHESVPARTPPRPMEQSLHAAGRGGRRLRLPRGGGVGHPRRDRRRYDAPVVVSAPAVVVSRSNLVAPLDEFCSTQMEHTEYNLNNLCLGGPVETPCGNTQVQRRYLRYPWNRWRRGEACTAANVRSRHRHRPWDGARGVGHDGHPRL